MTPQHAAFLVTVPGLHPQSSASVPTGVLFLDPGVPSAEEGAGRFTPENLPMPGPVVKAMLAQFAQLARESKSVADISAFAPSLYDDFYSGSSFAIRDSLEKARSGRQQEEDAAKALSKAQTELCLAWSLEEYAGELAGLNDKLDSQWATFSQSLGLDEEESLDEEQAGMAGAKPSLVPDLPRVPAPILVSAVLAFLPQDCGLYCQDQALLADWEEYGVDFREAAPQTLARFGLAGKFREAVAPGHLLCLSKRPDPARPWLDAARTVLAPAKE